MMRAEKALRDAAELLESGKRDEAIAKLRTAQAHVVEMIDWVTEDACSRT